MFKKIFKRMSVEIYVEGLEAHHKNEIHDFLYSNFDVKYESHDSENQVYYRIRATKSERRKLVKFVKFFEGHWFEALIIDNYIELVK